MENKGRGVDASFFKLVRNPLQFRLFLLTRLPAAFFAGLRVPLVNEKEAIVTVKYRWFTKNPFRSTYFACLSMAAEMSTGILAMARVHGRSPAVSMLVVETEGKFYKKATGLTFFKCAEGEAIEAAVNRAVETGEGSRVRVRAEGYNRDGEAVADFWFTWSFRKK